MITVIRFFNSKLKFIISKLLAGMLAWMLYMKIFISCAEKTTYALKVAKRIYLNPRDFCCPFQNPFASSKSAHPHFTTLFLISFLLSLTYFTFAQNEGIQLDTVLMHDIEISSEHLTTSAKPLS